MTYHRTEVTFLEHHEPEAFRSRLSQRIINTPSPAAKSAFFYLHEIGSIMPDDAFTTQLRAGDSFIIAAVTSGSGELNINGNTFMLSEGDCFFIDCRSPYYCKSSAVDPWAVMWVHFNGATSSQYYEHFLSHSGNVFRPSFFDKVVSAMNELIAVNTADSPDSEVLTSKLLVDILTLALTFSSSSDRFDTALKQKLAAVNRYIDDNFSTDISLEKLSSEFYISKFYLTREYKKIYGRTIFQHVISCRINYGKQLLRFSDKSVEEIAHLCGFNDQSYFARQFKKAENLTCFAYRKIWRDGTM